jgi:uncharacterized membrane protein
MECCIKYQWQSTVTTSVQMFCSIYGQVYGENILKSGMHKMGISTMTMFLLCAGIAGRK